MKKVLLIEDDEACAYTIQGGLELIGEYEVATASNGEEGWDMFLSFRPDIVVSDVDMPLLDGVALAERIRQHNRSVIIILESGRTAPKDVVRGYSVGVDDYIKKPFVADELHAHIEAIFRRISVGNSRVSDDRSSEFILIGSYRFYPNEALLIQPNGHEVKLTNREAGILLLLFKNMNSLVSRDEILKEFWGGVDYFHSRSLDVFISKLRKYLSQDLSIRIVNERGKGLRLEI